MLNRRILAASFALFAAMSAVAEEAREALTITTRAGQSHLFQVEVAQTPEARAKGLMFRRSMAEDHGMIFDFNPPQDVMMWMKNTYIPLDMVFIRADGTVHSIAESTTPFSETTISSQGRVSFVLEVNGGTAQRLGLSPGDRVSHRLIRP